MPEHDTGVSNSMQHMFSYQNLATSRHPPGVGLMEPEEAEGGTVGAPLSGTCSPSSPAPPAPDGRSPPVPLEMGTVSVVPITPAGDGGAIAVVWSRLDFRKIDMMGEGVGVGMGVWWDAMDGGLYKLCTLLVALPVCLLHWSMGFAACSITSCAAWCVCA